MKDNISVITIIFTSCLCLILISQVELYNLTCPSEAHWKIRAKVNCNSTLTYFCLHNNVKEIYVEGCNGPDWDRKGSKRIFSGSFTRGNCSQNRYQPFNFQTNGGMSDCIFEKSICSEEGQTIHQANSTKKDRTCRCDYAKNYAFIKTPRNFCYCIPTEEDCSCYIRSCPVNYTLSKDYECIRSGNQKKLKCFDKNIYNYTKKIFCSHYETVGEKTASQNETKYFLFHTRLKLERGSLTEATVLVCLCLILAIGGFSLALLLHKSTSEKLLPLEISFQRRQTGTLSRDDLNFLRMIHLLFQVACPVLKMKLINEIKPNQLRKSLDDNRSKMETMYRKNETIINDNQWDLLYNPVKGGTVKSEEFDIRLTIYLLCTLAKFKIDSVYPDPSDISDSAMLSRIKYIRNKAARRFEADLSEDKFKQYWNDIRQAVQTLVCKLDIKNDKDNTQIIENLKEKCRLIPESRHLHNRDYKFTDLATEENNFLVVFFVLAKMVYPFIKNEFNIKCTDWTFAEIGLDSCQKQFRKDEHSIKMQDINLTKENQQHYSSKMEESRNLDLRWMIFILKLKAVEEGKNDSIEQLDVINDIQREIVQSSSGMLNDERLHDIMKRTREAVLHLGGKWSEEQILHLQHTKNILNQ